MHVVRTATIAAALLVSGGASAELGGRAATVQVDSGRMNAQLKSTAMNGNVTRHALTRRNGGTVHEFTNAQGQVFAITWSGPGKPDLRTLLGRYFGTFQAASGASPTRMRAGHVMRRPTQVDQSDLQIQTAGHMGFFRGVAFIPSLAPAGFSTSDLAQEP